MITGVAFCPQAPALVPELGRGLDAELGALREACRTAIRRVAAPGDRVVVLGSGDSTSGYGPEGQAPTVGEWLVRDAVGADRPVEHVTPDALASLRTENHDVVLVVVGDGSARRSEKAPGHLDARSAPFDARVADALRSGQADRLDHHLLVHDQDEDLLVAGADAWDAVASALQGSTRWWHAELLYEGAPFGVGYFVAVWTSDPGPVRA